MHQVRQLVLNRPRLFVAAAAGIVVALLLPGSLSTVTRTLSAWNFGVWAYLLLIALLMLRANHHQVRKIAEQEDETAVAVVTTISFAAILSLAAIVIELGNIKGLPPHDRMLHYALVAATLIGSWFLVGVIFTLHYAHMYYSAAAEHRPLVLPGEAQNPDYWDFLYFSFTIAVAVQTSDVSLQTRGMRKAVLAQSVLSFFFNTAIIGLTINLAAGLIGA
ncbi:MAG TPA: DUF1345 domain-containing protein [Burkholderiales bacterium]|jgi:uncharacterized membrane protein|nr:DUF1345 domain-containing protein [Burkholderiales bacterium]